MPSVVEFHTFFRKRIHLYCVCLVTQSCLTLCKLMDCSPPGSSVLGWDSPGKNTGLSCHSFLQGLFLIQGLNLGLLNCRWILYHLSYQGSPIFLLLGLDYHECGPIRSINIRLRKSIYSPLCDGSFLFKIKS